MDAHRVFSYPLLIFFRVILAIEGWQNLVQQDLSLTIRYKRNICSTKSPLTLHLRGTDAWFLYKRVRNIKFYTTSPTTNPYNYRQKAVNKPVAFGLYSTRFGPTLYGVYDGIYWRNSKWREYTNATAYLVFILASARKCHASWVRRCIEAVITLIAWDISEGDMCSVIALHEKCQ